MAAIEDLKLDFLVSVGLKRSYNDLFLKIDFLESFGLNGLFGTSFSII